MSNIPEYDPSKYYLDKRIYGHNMNGEPLYRTTLVYKFIECKNCKKELHRHSGLKYKIVDGKKYADMDGDYFGIPCSCGFWNDL